MPCPGSSLPSDGEMCTWPSSWSLAQANGNPESVVRLGLFMHHPWLAFFIPAATRLPQNGSIWGFVKEKGKKRRQDSYFTLYYGRLGPFKVDQLTPMKIANFSMEKKTTTTTFTAFNSWLKTRTQGNLQNASLNNIIIYSPECQTKVCCFILLSFNTFWIFSFFLSLSGCSFLNHYLGWASLLCATRVM